MKAKKKKLHTQPPELKTALALPKEKRVYYRNAIVDKNFWPKYLKKEDRKAQIARRKVTKIKHF